MKLTREIKAAILVVSSLLLIVFTINYLKGQNLFDSSRRVIAIYDNVEGLASSASVTLNGHIIGKVQSIGFSDDASGKLEVKLLINDDFQFSKNSKAQIYESSLLGGKSIAILPANDNGENVVSGDVLIGVIKPGMTDVIAQKLEPLENNIELMLVGADSLLKNINEVFDAKTKSNLRHAIAELDQTMSGFKKTSQGLNDLILDNKASLNNTFSNFDKASSNLVNLTDSLASADITKMMNDLQKTLISINSVMAGLEKGEGSMGKLLKDETLYNNLEGATYEMEALLKDIKLHPKRYFRIMSKKEIPYKEEN